MDVQVKKRRRNGLRRGFLTCAAGEIDKQDVSGYLHTVPNISAAVHGKFLETNRYFVPAFKKGHRQRWCP